MGTFVKLEEVPVGIKPIIVDKSKTSILYTTPAGFYSSRLSTLKMRSAIVALTLLASAFAAPTADSTHSSEKSVTAPLEARAYSCNPLKADPCPRLCANGSGSINCSDSYCEETSAPNRGKCVCKCRY
ncbi:hypothetical protein B0T18DRAFT_422907 [Schizothecium vesticola]|uniref:Uncharacterized protein n=1 Tax=Schizothecium vesticola TaxID=314040 RepID=A0AA40BR23_9PEZI|nr:hypothetical protein B0T18DRAFT_422907 [Schizothecium vesticola]